MNFRVKHGMFGSIKYFIIEDTNVTLTTDMLGKDEANTLAAELRECADDLAFDEDATEPSTPVPDPRDALLNELGETLTELLTAVKDEPKMNHHKYDATGVRVNNVLSAWQKFKEQGHGS